MSKLLIELVRNLRHDHSSHPSSSQFLDFPIRSCLEPRQSAIAIAVRLGFHFPADKHASVWVLGTRWAERTRESVSWEIENGIGMVSVLFTGIRFC